MTIRYVDRAWTDPATGIILQDFKARKVMTSSTRRFNNSLHRTAKLSPMVRNLLDFIIQQMDSQNRICNNALFRTQFIDLMNNDCNVSVKEGTVYKGFQELQKAGLLFIMQQRRGVYTVNPIYYFNGTQSMRKHLIQRMLNASTRPFIGCNLKIVMGW